MDGYNIGNVDLHLYHGGKFIGENEYVGGKMELFDDVDYSDITLHQLEVLLKELGYKSVHKWGFRENGQIDKFCIFSDEAYYCDKFGEYVDFLEGFVEVYCECIDGDLHEQGGDSEEDMHHSDSSDGMEDADFSSDEEYLEARHNIRGMRFPNAGEQIPLPRYDKTCDHKSLVFAVGMQFKDFTECKEAIRMWAILNGRNVKWSKSDKQCKIEARCENGCPWRLYASKMNGVATFSIKSFESEHTCVRSYTNRQANCDWLMHVIMHDLKRNSDYPAKDIANDVKLKYDVSVDSRLCYKAKRKALKLIIRDTHESHYSKLRSYIAELQRVDKEGVFLLKSYLNANDQPIFQRCYIGFSALKKGFGIGCKKCICFDACFLKTELGGTVLSAVAKDCNNKMFPISWAVVEKENADTWNWFFGMLFENLGIVDGLGWTFMSDKHRGIINGIRKLAPRAEHRHCARHIFANWKKNFRDRKFKLLFWEAVKLTNEAQFKEKLLELKNVSPAAYEAFMGQVPSKFCKSLISQHTRTDCIQNNICETFNSYILKSRDKPIIEMLEDIRKHLMTKRCNMLDNMKSKTDILTPSVRKRLTKLQDGVKYCKLYRASEKKYEVSAFNHSYIVDLSQKECTCRFWTLSGIPCSHALACIFHARDDPNKYVDAFYLRQNCIEAYKHVLSPILDPKEWPIVEGPPILPPSYVKKPGRPKKNRRKDPSEVPKQGQKKLTKTGVKMSCKKCGEIGHNSRTCKVEKIIEPKPKGKRGRPRVPKPAALQEVPRREIRQATQGSGVVNGESGAIYAMQNFQAQSEGSSQRSQVVNETAES